MEYKKLKPQKMNDPESECRAIWEKVYCDPSNPVYTFDGILVKFYADMFDHAFYESANRERADKSILSLNRLEKMLWIKDTLQDQTALLKQGWDRKSKSYTNSRRVAFVKGSYIVVILIINEQKARFITAYEMQGNEEKVKNSPDWQK